MSLECILGSPGDGVWGKELWLGNSMATVLSYYKPAPSLEVLILPLRQSLGFRLVIPTLGTLDPWISIEILQRSANKHSQFKICLSCVCTTTFQIY